MIFYMHPNGQADFRKPVRLSVGPYHYKFPDGREVFDPDMKNLPKVYEYQQLQIESDIKMTSTQALRQFNFLMLSALIFTFAAMLLVAMLAPEHFGGWLQQIDNGRYGGVCYEHDYTEEL